MGFMVYPWAVRAMANELGVAAEVAKVAERYASRHGQLDWHAQGLLALVIGAHQDFVDRLDKRLAHLHDLLTESGIQLNEVAAAYEHTDTASAARIDATLPPVARNYPEPD
jgi:uncharacterized protein YukE